MCNNFFLLSQSSFGQTLFFFLCASLVCLISLWAQCNQRAHIFFAANFSGKLNKAIWLHIGCQQKKNREIGIIMIKQIAS